MTCDITVPVLEPETHLLVVVVFVFVFMVFVRIVLIVEGAAPFRNPPPV
jgi:ABC-type sugar transport system permease subunit